MLMSNCLKITWRTFTMWLVAALANGFMSGIALTMVHKDYYDIIPNIVQVCFITLIFSIPSLFLFWISLLVFIANALRQRDLFRAALVSALLISLATAYIGRGIYSDEYKNYSSVPFLAIVLSAFISVILHFKYFKKIK